MPMGKKYYTVKLKELCIFGSVYVKAEYILNHLVKRLKEYNHLCTSLALPTNYSLHWKKKALFFLNNIMDAVKQLEQIYIYLL